MPTTQTSRSRKTAPKATSRRGSARKRAKPTPRTGRKPAAAARRPTAARSSASDGARAARMSDEAVRKATGKVWSEWFALLDGREAGSMKHPEIAELAHELGAGPWWAQMITVAYERARGLRDVNQKTDGYSANASKTIAVPISAIFRAWYDPSQRRRWLPDAELTIRRATPDKSLRITWTAARGPDSSVEVNFYPKGDGRAQVAVQHNKLPDRTAFMRMKTYWVDRLNTLKGTLES